MARSNHITNSFISGEISPKALGRTEIDQYNRACEDLFNSIVYPQGGAGKRPGTIFEKDAKYTAGTLINTYSAQYRFIPFRGSDGSRWQILITAEGPETGVTNNFQWRAYRVSTGAVVGVQPWFDTPVGFSIRNEWNLGARGINLQEIQYRQAGDMLFLVHGNMRPIRIAYNDVGFASPNFIAYPFPYPSYGAVGASNRAMPFLPRVFDQGNDNAISVTSRASDTTIVAGDMVDISPLSVTPTYTFDSTWVYRQIKFSTGTESIVVEITAVTDADDCEGRVLYGTMGVTGPSYTKSFGSGLTNFYELGAWDDEKGWPRAVGFFEGRLVFAGSQTYGDWQWYSEIDDLYEFDYRGCVQDADYLDPETAEGPFDKPLRAGELDDIRWLITGKNITMGSNSQEFIAQGASDTSSIAFDNYKSNAEGSYGSAYQQAFRKENAVIFLQKNRRTLREMVFDFTEQQTKAENLNILGEHIAKKSLHKNDRGIFQATVGKIVALAIQEDPHGLIWALDDSGSLLGLTRERAQQVAAWHSHELGGTSYIGADEFKPEIKTISVIDKEEADGETDELWMVVRRGYGTHDPGTGGTLYSEKFFIEKMAPEWDQAELDEHWVVADNFAPIYVDCAVVTDSFTEADASGLIEDLPHGKGAVLDVVCNGLYYGQYTVDENNSINISDQLDGETFWQVVCGFAYTNDIVPTVPEVPATLGSSQGQPRRIDQITIHFYRTAGAKFGRVTDKYQDETPIDPMEDIEFEDRNGEAKALFTGEKKVVFPGGYESRPKVRISSSLPFPMCVTHVVSRMVVYEG